MPGHSFDILSLLSTRIVRETNDTRTAGIFAFGGRGGTDTTAAMVRFIRGFIVLFVEDNYRSMSVAEKNWFFPLLANNGV